MHISIRPTAVERLDAMPERNRLLGPLDVVSYYRAGAVVFVTFHHGRHSVAMTAELTTVPSAEGDPWFQAQSSFQVRPLADPLATWADRGAIEGYGRTEEDALLAAVKLFLDRLDASGPGGPSRPRRP